MLTMDETAFLYFNTKCGEIYVSDCLTKLVFICSYCNKSYLNYFQLNDHLKNIHFVNGQKKGDDFLNTNECIDAISEVDIIEEVNYESDDYIESSLENIFETEQANLDIEQKDKCEIVPNQTLYEIEIQSELDINYEADTDLSNDESDIVHLEQPEEINVTCPTNRSDYYISEDDNDEANVKSETVDPLDKLTGRQFKISISRPFVQELLNKYKNLPILWDQSDKDYYSRNKDEAYAELISVYNKFNLEADKNIVKRKLQSLRNSFRKELNLIGNNGKKCATKHKYFKNMKFLLGMDEINFLDSESSDSSDSNGKIGVRGLVQNTKFVKEFIDIYKESPVLWKRSDPVYQNRELRNVAYDKLIDKYREYDLKNGDLIHVLRKIKSLRMSFRKVLDHKKMAINTGHFFETQFKYFDQMMFLANEIRSKEEEQQETEENFKQINFESRRSIEFVKDFIATVKSLPSLWDPSNSKYSKHGKANKNDLKTLVKKYKEYNPDAKVGCEFVYTNWQTLQSTFKEEFKKQEVAKSKGDTYVPTFQYFNDMLFLTPVIEINDIDDNDSNGNNLKNDREKPYIDKMYKCDRCNRAFATECRFKYHQMSHDGIFSCDICNNEFKKLIDLMHHKKVHGLEKAYECETCGKKFSHKNSLRLHTSTHLSSDERPFECDYCGNKFSAKGNYLVHVKRHESVTQFKCDICNKAFVTSTELKAHSYTHKNMKQYVCELCGKDFKQRICFQNHVRKIHGTAEPQYKCNLCNKSYYTSKTLNNHKVGHNKVRKHVCEKCGAKFHTRYNYTLHMRTHMTVKMFVCDICQKGFNQASVLRNHIKKKHD